MAITNYEEYESILSLCKIIINNRQKFKNSNRRLDSAIDRYHYISVDARTDK